MVATTPTSGAETQGAWREAGAEVLVFEEPGPAGGVPLGELMQTLGKRDVQDVLVEGGPTVAWVAVQEGVVDRLVLYLAPKLVGGESAPGILGGKGFGTLADALGVDLRSVEMVGPDVKVVGDVHRDR